MLFKFLKYLQPTHYFGLKTRQGHLVFPKWEAVPNHIKFKYKEDQNYTSKIAQQYDQSWRIINNGVIENIEGITRVESIPLYDNYVFARKYFNKAWVFYVLGLRLIHFNNPIKELNTFFRTRHVKRYKRCSEQTIIDGYTKFNSKLVESNPIITVVIPTLNRYCYLNDVLKDLEQQDYKNFEVIVVDQSTPFNGSFYEIFNLNLRVVNQKEKALWLARNNAIKMAKGEYLLLFDDDSRIEYDWIKQHLKAIDFYKADLSSGVSISKTGGKVPEHYQFFKISDQLDTGNVLIKRTVFESIGLFDRQFEKQRMGDGEFGLRAYKDGFKNISNPYAKRLHLKVESGGLREMGSWDAFRTKNLFQPRPIPSVLYFFRSYFGATQAKYAIFRTVPISILPYQFKKSKVLVVLGSLFTVVLLPFVLFQVLRSWHLASMKISQGPLIDKLK